MKIYELYISNFRKFTKARFRFNAQSNVTVLIGDNATGKSAILNSLSIMISSYLLDFKVPGAVRHIRKDEVHLKQVVHDGVASLEPQWSEGVALSCIGSLHELYQGDDSTFRNAISWSRELTSEASKTTRINAKLITGAGKNARMAVEQGEGVLLPVLAYYGTGRLWHSKKDIPLAEPDSRAIGYRDCLDPASNHNLFLKWFSRLELASIQKRKKYGVLEAVREAVRQCIPQCSNIYFDFEFNQLMTEFEDGRLLGFDNLSDGYRNMLAIVADISHRAARLNPHLGSDAAVNTPGIVLIDEIDLHLHPKWQRIIVNNLREAFPKVQFIVSTHSPFIIQSLKAGEVIDLNATSHLAVEGQLPQAGCLVDYDAEQPAEPSPAKGFSERSIEDIVEDVMGIGLPSRSARLERMYKVAEKYYELLDQGSKASGEEKEKLKAELDQLSAPFSENVAYHAFLERKRIKAGILSQEEKETQ
ncbi:AAA family ATPase [Thalassomonas viridans]|uniref:AAA family ATPase n=1 Tax=Thalassomonas viridans TaxID=137584 RepID=A0AAE9Z5B0_9GAMM|nr:AAA family ATPase [Thalassomonas viridans]WDE06873.1 AAA family ATPase [Thalassomonas viridans]